MLKRSDLAASPKSLCYPTRPFLFFASLHSNTACLACPRAPPAPRFCSRWRTISSIRWRPRRPSSRATASRRPSNRATCCCTWVRDSADWAHCIRCGCRMHRVPPCLYSSLPRSLLCLANSLRVLSRQAEKHWNIQVPGFDSLATAKPMRSSTQQDASSYVLCPFYFALPPIQQFPFFRSVYHLIIAVFSVSLSDPAAAASLGGGAGLAPPASRRRSQGAGRRAGRRGRRRRATQKGRGGRGGARQGDGRECKCKRHCRCLDHLVVCVCWSGGQVEIAGTDSFHRAGDALAARPAAETVATVAQTQAGRGQGSDPQGTFTEWGCRVEVRRVSVCGDLNVNAFFCSWCVMIFRFCCANYYSECAIHGFR